MRSAIVIARIAQAVLRAAHLFCGMMMVVVGAPLGAHQATTAQDARQAYGSRLTREAAPEVSRGAVRRLNSRVENRINNRLSTRIERYKATVDPTASLRTNAVAESGNQPTVVPTPLPDTDQNSSTRR